MIKIGHVPRIFGKRSTYGDRRRSGVGKRSFRLSRLDAPWPEQAVCGVPVIRGRSSLPFPAMAQRHRQGFGTDIERRTDTGLQAVIPGACNRRLAGKPPVRDHERLPSATACADADQSVRLLRGHLTNGLTAVDRFLRDLFGLR